MLKVFCESSWIYFLLVEARLLQYRNCIVNARRYILIRTFDFCILLYFFSYIQCNVVSHKTLRNVDSTFLYKKCKGWVLYESIIHSDCLDARKCHCEWCRSRMLTFFSRFVVGRVASQFVFRALPLLLQPRQHSRPTLLLRVALLSIRCVRAAFDWGWPLGRASESCF